MSVPSTFSGHSSRMNDRQVMFEALRTAARMLNAALVSAAEPRSQRLLEASIDLRDVVEDISGAVLSARAETDDRGTYNAEHIDIADSQFRRIGGAAIDLYRGGSDESTFGPVLTLTGTRLQQVGNTGDASLRLHGVQRVVLLDNQFIDSAAVRAVRTTGTPRLIVARNQFVGTPALQSDYLVEPLL